jgi:hypothetical protein
MDPEPDAAVVGVENGEHERVIFREGDDHARGRGRTLRSEDVAGRTERERQRTTARI